VQYETSTNVGLYIVKFRHLVLGRR